MGIMIDGTEVIVQVAPDDVLFAESPTWEELTTVRNVQWQLSGRTTEIDQSQPGTLSLLAGSLNRELDIAWGPGSVTFDGSGSDYWGCGDLAAFNGATELDIRACIAPDDWSPSTAMTFAAQWNSTGNQRSWQFDIDTNGYLSLALSSGGTAATSVVNSGARASAVDGQTMCVRVTWQSSDGATKFYIKRVPPARARKACLSHVGWMKLGATATGMTAGLFNSTASVTVGDRAGATQPFDGKLLYADARTTIGDDTLAFAFWPGNATSTAVTSWVSSVGAGETWTKTGASTVIIQGNYFERMGTGTPVRVIAIRDGDTYELFTGYLRRAPQSYPSSGKDSVVRLTATDAFGFLAEQMCPDTPSLFGAGGPGHYWPLHEGNNVQQAADVIGNRTATWSAIRSAGGPTQPGAPNLTTQALLEGTYLSAADAEASIDWSGGVQLACSFYLPTAAAKFRLLCGNGFNTVGVCYGVGGEYYVMGNGASVAELFDNRLDVGWHTFGYYSNGGAGGSFLAYFDGAPIAGSGGFRSAVSTPTALYLDGSAAAVSDIALTEEGSGNSAAYLGPEGGAGQTTAERMETLLQAAMGNVPALWDLTTDETTYLGPTGLSTSFGELVRQVNIAEQGRLHINGSGLVTFRSRNWVRTATAATVSQVTFGENEAGGEVPYVDGLSIDPGSKEDVINEVTVTLPNGTSGHYEDPESIASNGRRHVQYSAPLASPDDAQALAKHIVGLKAWPLPRVTGLTIRPDTDDKWEQCLTRTQGDRVTVKRRTTDTITGGASTEPLTAVVCVESIAYTVDRSGRFEATFLTTPAPPTAAEAGYFTLDDAVLGMLDAGISLAY